MDSEVTIGTTGVIVDTMSEAQLCEMLGVSKVTLWRWRKLDKGPRGYVLAGRRWSYVRADVEAWLSAGGFAKRNKVPRGQTD